ncbi:hypothetical protein QBC47DRAFT_401863 [Echria macrotheca]|uniref:K Homology domain-containing protein n=1 Tax=Echria macrotheca TaxID=438768 RepID=A0AAJ0FC06_9PEZI|nr:hypothetical protein QBC47DRAFT_401863 [Echria macrotheca]
MADTAPTQPSAASQLLQQHIAAEAHHVTVDDVPDEAFIKPAASPDAPTADSKPSGAESEPMSTKAAGKQKAKDTVGLDTQSHELFPELGGPKPKANTGVAPIWDAKSTVNGKASGASPANGTPRSSAPASGVTTPTGPSLRGPGSVTIPGRNVETLFLEPHHLLPRSQLKRPIPDILRDVNRKSRATISMHTAGNGKFKLEAVGTQDVALKALKDLMNQIGSKQVVKVPIPNSARAHIIGKGGSTIKSLQEKHGARIQLPKAEDNQAGDEDEDQMIDVHVEGNALSAAAARDAILKIAGERATNVNTRMKGVPAEFYPFIAGPKNTFVHKLEEDNGVQIRVPPHQAMSSQPPTMPAPGQAPAFAPAPSENCIQLAGDRNAVQAARAAIERRVEELRSQLALDQVSLQHGRHRFIIGDNGASMDEFFEETGCTIILPNDEDDDMVTVIGPRDNVQAGLDRAIDLAMKGQCLNFDISRFHRQAPGGAAAHARNVTRYLRHKNEIQRLEKAHNVKFTTRFTEEGVLPWELSSRDGKNAIRAQSEIKDLVDSHPPARMTTLTVDPFFHTYIKNEIQPRVRQDYGVQLVVPDPSETNFPILLVYEGPSSPDSYEVPRSQPTQPEINEMRKWLQEAQKHIQDVVDQQEEISAKSLEIPLQYHEKLKKFIKKEQDVKRDANKPSVRASGAGATVTFRGPRSDVASLVAKCEAFIEQEKQDEKERGFTLEFEFPQKFANHLIGKGGSNIRELRERFDVDIQVQDGKVQLKGPKAKAEAAKAHIIALGRQLQDETTHILKIDPKFHSELIGAQGAQITRLQTRHKVLIFIPRNAKTQKDDDSVVEVASEAGKPRRQQAPDEVVVRGPKKGADDAREEILTFVQYLKDNSFTAVVSVQQEQVKSLIGIRGAALEQLRQDTGARIDIPSERDTPNGLVEIQIKGTKAQVAAAKKIIEEKKAIFDDTITKTLEVDRKYHPTLIGAGGSNIRDIVVQAGGSDDRHEVGRTVRFPERATDGNMIKVQGPREVVNKIVAHIEAFVAQRANQVTETIEVPVDKHRSLIGRGGDIKRGLEAQFKVSIDIPRQGSGQTGVKIVGQSADVEKAKAHIQSMLKEQQGETVQVPRALHHAVSNNGQFFRKLRNDFHVSVDHAGQAVPAKPAVAGKPRANGSALPLITDDAEATADVHSWNVVENTSTEEGDLPWVLRGSAENVEKAKKAIESALEQAKNQNATGYLVLPDPKTYRYVIGQGGSKVNQIRKQSGCKITVPKDQAKDEAIEVVGTKEGVEKAKDLILAAVKEGLANGRARGPRG